MSPSQHFRRAHELYYRLSFAQTSEQGMIRAEFEAAILEVTANKATVNQVRVSIIEFNDSYCCLRMGGKSPEDAFNLIRPTRPLNSESATGSC